MNVGANTIYDRKIRILLRDGVIIERYQLHFFFFLNGRQKNRKLRLASWNINELKDKLQEPNILNFVLGYDVI